MDESLAARRLALAVILAGVMLVAFGGLADILGGNTDIVFGIKQALVMGAGIAVIGVGGLLMTGRGQRYVARLDEKSAPSWGPGLILLAVLWLGVLAGLGELLILNFQKPPHHFLDQRFLTPHAGWKTPLSYVLLLAVPGVVLAAAAALRVPVLHSARIGVSVLAFFVFYGWLQLYASELGRNPILLLSLGLAAVMGRLTARYAPALMRTLPRGAPFLVAVALLIGLAVPAAHWWRERQELNREPAAASGSNVLLIILDTVRARNMSLYGYARSTTPFLERLAEQSAVFDLAISAAPWTLPSHAAMFTGRNPLQLSTEWTMPLDETFSTLAEVLAEAGYMTAGFVANAVYCGPHTGLARGFVHYDVDVNNLGGILTASALGRDLLERRQVRGLFRLREEAGFKLAPMVSDEFLRWVDRPRRRPFFAFLNYMDAHTSHLPQPAVEGRFASDSVPIMPARVMDRATEKRPGVRKLINQYDERIAILDEALERLVSELDRRGLLDSTLLIIASDHGEEFGERGVMYHGRSLYAPSLHVPLLVRYPGRVPAGLRVTKPVGLRNLPVTVLDLLIVGDLDRFPGQSLARNWASASAGSGDVRRETGELEPYADEAVLAETNGKKWMPEYNPVSRGDMRSFITADFHYILNGDGVEELYRTSGDPWDQDDIVHMPETDSVLQTFRNLSAELPALGPGSNVNPLR